MCQTHKTEIDSLVNNWLEEKARAVQEVRCVRKIGDNLGDDNGTMRVCAISGEPSTERA